MRLRGRQVGFEQRKEILVPRVERNPEEFARVAHDGRGPRPAGVRLQSHDVAVGDVRPWRSPVIRSGGGKEATDLLFREPPSGPGVGMRKPRAGSGLFGAPDDALVERCQRVVDVGKFAGRPGVRSARSRGIAGEHDGCGGEDRGQFGRYAFIAHFDHVWS